MRIEEIINILSSLGYTLVRIRGSHFQFKEMALVSIKRLAVKAQLQIFDL